MLHDFSYVSNELYCEKVRVADIVKKTGTPVYIYSRKTFVEHIEKIQRAFRTVKPLICYSMKANSNLAVLKSLVAAGSGLDIVSGGELFRAKRVGCRGGKVVYAGVGKTQNEIEEALRYGVLFFNAESVPELEAINEAAGRLKKRAKISIRVNPEVDAGTHEHIATGKIESKFGLDFETVESIFKRRLDFPNLSLCGIHVHIGSQIVSADPFVAAFRKVLAFIEKLEAAGAKIEYLDLGGGLGVIYNNETPQTAEEFASRILPLFPRKKFRIVLEPGRFVAANAGILVGKVLYVKRTKVKNFAIMDTGMGDLIRPSLYGAYHDVRPLVQKEYTPRWKYDVVGPICESGDFLAKDRMLQEIQSGDHLAFMTAGAYGFVMSSNYNSRPLPCEVLVHGKRFNIVRRRQALKDLIAGETLPK